MKKYRGFIIGVITGMMIASLPIFADSYSRAIDAVVNFTNIQVNGKPLQSDNMLIDDKTYVWIRDVANLLDKDIIWDENTNTANIVDKGSIPNTAITVNGQAITDRQIKSFRLLNPTNTKDNVINSLIEKVVIMQKAPEFGLEPFETYLENAKKSVEEDLVNYPKEFPEYLEKNGFTPNEYANVSAENEIANAVIETMYQNALNDYKLDDKEIRAKYNENIKDYETVTAKHILVSDENKAKDLYNQLKRGADFDKLMMENTEDPGTKNEPDGYTFTRGQMVPEFENAAFTQEIGKLYEPVKTAYGYHIILVTKKGTVPFEDAFEDIVYEIFSESMPKTIEQWKSEAEIIFFDDIINSL